MSTEIKIDKKSVKDFLSEKGPFVIPVYQRPYTWSEDDEIQTLFDDIIEFVHNGGSENEDLTYFLGCVVSFTNSQKEQEIIDGQQRITSLFLLLRAIYTKAQKETSEQAENFRKQIEPTLWRCNKKGDGKPLYDQVLIRSEVIDEDANNTFREILRTGKADPDAKDQYSKNYLHFQKLLDEYAVGHSLGGFYDFVYAVLNQAILLPISADTQDTALTIFNTLNNRGKPLSDADIFKAKIYEHHKDPAAKSSFIQDWKDLEESTKNTGDETIQKLFTYYMFYLRAKEGDISSSTPGVRKYYAQDDKERGLEAWWRLYDENIMSNLNSVLNIFRVIYNRQTIDDEEWSKDFEICKCLDILKAYPNEYWKYPVVTYYLEYRNEPDFQELFLNFLHKFISQLLPRFIHTPSLNFVKSDILKLDHSITKSKKPDFDFKEYSEKEFKEHLKNPNLKITRMLLTILAYYNSGQTELLPIKWEIEHIYPQKWDKNHFPALSDAEVKKKVECIGNKIPLEKRLNIQASNGFFSKKQDYYRKSKIAVAKSLAEFHGDWTIDNIDERNIRLSDAFIELMDDWDKNYQTSDKKPETNEPSEEDKAMIEYLKSKNLI